MRLISKDIQKATSSVIKFIPNRPSHPILANVMFVPNIAEQTLTLTGFNLSDGCTVTIPAVVTNEDVATTLPAKMFNDIISKVTDYEVELLMTELLTKIRTKLGTYEVRGMDNTEYPALEFVGDVEAIAVQNDVFFNGVDAVLFSVSTEEVKQVLTGVKLTSVNGQLEFASTDGHRLSVSSIDCDVDMDVTIPGAVLGKLSSLMSKPDTGFILVQTDERHIVFESENVKVVSRLLAGKYPSYNQLIPKQFSSSVVLNRRELISALERVNVIQMKNGITLFNFNGTFATVSAKSSECGEASESLTIVKLDGEPPEFAANVKYVTDALKSLKSDVVKIQMNSKTSPFVIVPDDVTDTKLLVMPVQVRD